MGLEYEFEDMEGDYVFGGWKRRVPELLKGSAPHGPEVGEGHNEVAEGGGSEEGEAKEESMAANKGG